MRIRITSYIRLLTVTAIAAVTAACSAFHEPEIPCPQPEPEPRSPLALTFDVSTRTGITASRAIASRADDQGHDEDGSDYPSIEDYINLNDFGFFIFAGTDNRLLYMNTDVITSSGDALDMTITGSSGNYTVSLVLDDDVVEAILPGDEPLSPSGTRTLPLTIAIVANSNASRGEPGLDDFKTLTAVTADNVPGASVLDDFIAIAEEMKFTPETKDAEQLIPMYGISSFTLTEPQMYYSRPDERLELGEISLLRAMCKLRVIDGINDKTDGFPKVVGASVSYPRSGGFVTPRNPASYQNGQQIHGDQEALPSDMTAHGTDKFLPGTVKENSFVAYAPAQPLTVEAPVLTISVQRDAASAPQDFTVDLLDPQYTIIAQSWGTMMLRNHVYTIQVTGVTFGASLELTATVADWEESTFRFDYTDGVSTTTAGAISWDDSTIEQPKDLDTHTVTLKPWSAGQAVAARLTFGLATPKGAQWVASLINTSGDASAIQFQPVEGLTVSDDGKSITGTVPATGDQLLTLRIASTIEKPTVTSTDKLQIVVQTQGGAAWAVVTTPDGTILNEWTIVQRQQEI